MPKRSGPSGKHRPPTEDQCDRVSALVTKLFPLGTPYPALALANAIGVHPDPVTRVLSGKRAVSEATVAGWERAVDAILFAHENASASVDTGRASR
jgi:hypothetical protein